MRLCILLLCVGLVAPLAAQAPTVKAIATVRQLHDAMIVPASNALFKVESAAPKNKAGWTAARNQALIVAESGNLLMLGTRARDKGRWMTFSRALVDGAAGVIKALDAQSLESVSEANGGMLEACESCHTVYRDKGKGMPR